MRDETASSDLAFERKTGCTLLFRTLLRALGLCRSNCSGGGVMFLMFWFSCQRIPFMAPPRYLEVHLDECGEAEQTVLKWILVAGWNDRPLKTLSVGSFICLSHET